MTTEEAAIIIASSNKTRHEIAEDLLKIFPELEGMAERIARSLGNKSIRNVQVTWGE